MIKLRYFLQSETKYSIGRVDDSIMLHALIMRVHTYYMMRSA